MFIIFRFEFMNFKGRSNEIDNCSISWLSAALCFFHSQMTDLIITSPLTSIYAELQNHSIQMNSSSYATGVHLNAVILC